MVTRYSFKNRIFRAGFYVISIGGLMLVFSGVLWLCWNRFLVERYQYSALSFLEAIGLVSIAYVVYSSLRFSSADECSQQETNGRTQSEHLSHSTNDANSAHQSRSTACQELDSMQKEQLKREIERCCGKQAVQSATSSVPGLTTKVLETQTH